MNYNTKISNPTQEMVLDLLNIGEEKLIKDSELVSKMNDLLKDGLIDKQKYEEVISINTKKINKNKKMRAIQWKIIKMMKFTMIMI